MKIAFLHTSASHIERFNKIVNEIDDTIQVEHYVNEELLERTIKTGFIDEEGFNREIYKIKETKISNIICTCSTYGELCNEEKKVYRIDKPIGKYIVSKFSKIGIAFTVKSTKEKSKDLLQSIAIENHKSIHIKEIDCQHCWEWFEKGDFDKYETEIAKQIKKQGDNCEIIFLAQASMEGAKAQLIGRNYEVVSSPKFGVQKYLERIKREST